MSETHSQASLIDRINQAIGLHSAGRDEEALAAYTELLRVTFHIAIVINAAALLEKKGDYGQAADLLSQGLARDESEPPAFLNLSRLLIRLGRLEDAIPVARRYIELKPVRHDGWVNLGGILHSLGRTDEAAQAFRKAVLLKPTLIEHLEGTPYIEYVSRFRGKAIHLDPKNAVTMTAEEAERRAVRVWPSKMTIDGLAGLEKVVRGHVLRHLRLPPPFLNPASRIVTLGSCFATNFGVSLQALGADVTNTIIGEDINSTYANRYFMDWLLDAAPSDIALTLERMFGQEMKSRMLQVLGDADILVMTLGVAPCLFRRSDNAFVLRTGDMDQGGEAAILRTTSVGENVVNLRHILKTLRALNRNMRIVFTVSPVPLAGTTEMDSAIISDCVSKSVIRVAVHEFVQENPEVLYWPSFEIVRWLGGHSNFAVFGGTDGESRHVNRDLVDLIVRLFVERCGQGFAEAAPKT